MMFQEYQDLHKGKTFLLVGNGTNLLYTPPEWFSQDFISIGMNTIHMYGNWRPTYYTAVDRRVAKEFGATLNEQYRDIPKFIPERLRPEWKGENFVYFKNAPGVLWAKGRGSLWQSRLSEVEITYGNIMHVAMKLAFFMGAKTILIIGMEHNPANANGHFWGVDPGMPSTPPLVDWCEGYSHMVQGLHANGVNIFNISKDTFVSEDIIPRGNYNDWR